jgi:hypothetical protein
MAAAATSLKSQAQDLVQTVSVFKLQPGQDVNTTSTTYYSPLKKSPSMRPALVSSAPKRPAIAAAPKKPALPATPKALSAPAKPVSIKPTKASTAKADSALDEWETF